MKTPARTFLSLTLLAGLCLAIGAAADEPQDKAFTAKAPTAGNSSVTRAANAKAHVMSRRSSG